MRSLVFVPCDFRDDLAGEGLLRVRSDIVRNNLERQDNEKLPLGPRKGRVMLGLKMKTDDSDDKSEFSFSKGQ